ncbi:hypothetical protein CEXT_178611 [Caerostris extrusa]|uniref:Uncharacterized protein n=1 Tax=Caerostris extrusa TaxID=172846 RepID=A0AAV4Q3U4_CAEEX|nr:hypothetical protein CEXT_178611 [Caerostris extrusa]
MTRAVIPKVTTFSGERPEQTNNKVFEKRENRVQNWKKTNLIEQTKKMRRITCQVADRISAAWFSRNENQI